MTRITPRPTQHLSSLGLDGGHVFRSVDTYRDRPTRFCTCGTRLRRDKPTWELLCDPCDQKQRLEQPPAELHPIITNEGRASPPCPTCGGPMWRGAKTCHDCRVNTQKHAAKG